MQEIEYTRVLSRGIQSLTGNWEQGILTHYPTVAKELKAATPPGINVNLVTGEVELSKEMDYLSPEILAPRIAQLSFLDGYLQHSFCPHVELGKMFGGDLTVASLLQDEFTVISLGGAVFHLVTHTMHNMVYRYQENLGLPEIAVQLDRAMTRRSTTADRYRYFLIGEVGNWLGALETKFVAALAMVIAIIEDWPLTDHLTEEHWIQTHEELEPIDLTEWPWRELLCSTNLVRHPSNPCLVTG